MRFALPRATAFFLLLCLFLEPAAAWDTITQYSDKGLKISVPDTAYSLNIRGYVNADSRIFLNNSNPGKVDTLLIRNARPIVEATFPHDLRARMMVDFAGGQTRLIDAFVDYSPSPLARLRVGKFKAPIGLERWQGEQDIVFVERGMATNLVPFRDMGVQVFGEIIPKKLEYNLAYTSGAPDLNNPSGDTDNGRDITARLFAHPFRGDGLDALKGLGIGLAGSAGNRDGNPTDANLGSGYRTPAQARFLSYTTGATAAATPLAAGHNWRINPQAYYYLGSFSALGEYVRTGQDVRLGSLGRTLNHDAFTLITTYVLTGEEASFEGVKPKTSFNPAQGAYGAVEIAARYSALNLDSDTFPTFASTARSSKKATDATLGLNWYLSTRLKFNVNYSETHFSGGAAANQDRGAEKVLLSRVQFRF